MSGSVFGDLGDTPEGEGAIVLAPATWLRCAPGSQVVRAGCGHLGWMSPESLPLHVGRNVRTVCMACLPADVAAQRAAGEDVYAVAVPGALEAIERQFGGYYAAQVRAGMARMGIAERVEDVEGGGR